MRCYVPLANLGTSAAAQRPRGPEAQGTATFVLTALDPQRRGRGAGAARNRAPCRATRARRRSTAEVRLAKSPQKRAAGSGTRRSELGKPPVPTASTPPPGRRPAGRGATDAPAVEAPAAPAATALPAEVSKAPAKKAPAKKAAAKKPAAKKPAVKEGPAKEGPAKEAAAKKAAAKKAPPTAGRAGKKALEAKPVPAKSAVCQESPDATTGQPRAGGAR